MTTIERLKEQIEESAHHVNFTALRKAADVNQTINQTAIMQALVELLEKVDQPMEFSIPTQTPNVTQYIIGKPVRVIPEHSQPTVIPQQPQPPTRGPHGLPPTQS